MKRMVFAIAAMMLLNVVSAQESAVKVPSGYQGFLEQGQAIRFADDGDISVSVSTTHGFYFSDNTFIGVGLALEGGNGFFGAPFYTALKYNFTYNRKVTPTMQLRLGSYLSDNVGAYADAAFGLRFGSSRDFAINVMITASYYSTQRSYSHYNYETHDYEYVRLNPSCVGLRLGIEW